MGMFSGLPMAAPIDPIFNTGMLVDIPTGGYVRGLRGENVLIGGHGITFSITGEGNSFKTDQMLAGSLQILDRIPCASLLLYDTENSFKYARFKSRTKTLESFKDFDFIAEGYKERPRIMLVKKSDISGDAFIEKLKEIGKARLKDKSEWVHMPVGDCNGNPVRMLKPLIVMIDTLSHFSVSSVDDNIVDKSEIGGSGANMLFMRDGAAKTQLILQIPTICAKYGIHVFMSAHIGSFIKIDQYAPGPIKLNFGKAGTKHKGVPEKFMQLNEHLIEITNNKPLLTKEKLPKYPVLESDREKGNDLFMTAGYNTRNKGGPSGIYFPFIYSQAEGLKRGLTMFDYLCVIGNWFGIDTNGNKSNYGLDLCPGGRYMRTTIREACDHKDMLRALEITVEMYQMRILWRKETDELYNIEPAVLRNKVEELGYNWETLLNTRGYYVPLEDEAEAGDKMLPFLSTLDLLEMAQGTYHPYWLEKDKVTIKKNYWKHSFK
jgi:hypothetical protein